MNAELTTVRAVVRDLRGDEALVEVEQGGCGRCHETGGCGGQHLTQMMCSGPKTYRVRNTGARVGDHVTVAIAAGAVARSANLAYAMPLAGLIGGAALGMTLAGDVGAMAGGGLGLAGAWLGVRARVGSGAGANDFHPYLIDR